MKPEACAACTSTATPESLGVTLDIEAGQFVAVTGPSGSGKSTLTRASRDQGPPVSAGQRIQSIAVLPLDNLSGNSGEEYFVTGMHEAGRLVRRLELPPSGVWLDPASMSQVYAALGDTNRAMDWLKKGLEERSTRALAARQGATRSG
jgi:energy-coupling factor transporter ATP-binding protein EcfA2